MFNLPYNKFHKTLEIVTFILLLAQIVYTAVLYPQLPSKIPSHFNLEGQIDGWSGKESIIILVISFSYITYCSISATKMGWWFTPVMLVGVLGVTFYYTFKLFLVK